ncbi:GGDEF domain-containing protein [Clostridium magnum]|uniref:Phytochrome-like protein cph2 n=1 Tax=Clostridium magnum DSM 2767 TaxID=1121326 RepID=A0A161X863_9CLOT|nr:GGDEF domain-containing protein [Clostridium magnum]KZL90346.1 phytochrome-like protein cph2 [Clostridium magnum DSM 2767]SHH82678.1 diguanylate cyclase/phosphodiesterase [Clostridium magnum DSM 2767]
MINPLVKISDYTEVEELKSIIRTKNISTVYQPIVSLSDGKIIGYEALSRGPIDSPLQTPDKLFKAAQVHNKTWELEQLCRIKAIEKAANIEKNKYLFINVDPHIFKDEKFKKGFTKEFLAQHNMSPECIIFEITEKTCIEDYKGFKQALSNYVDQGYKIAIDDTGSGYSGLKMLNETKPHFIKIDMDLIRNINEDSFKQSLIECFVKLSESTNMKLIAEGIETEEELETLINLGVYAGQGFFIGRPAGTFLDISNSVKDFIIRCNKLKNNICYSYQYNTIGEIVRRDKAFSPTTQCKEIKEYFDDNDITGACIVNNNNIPVGLIMRHSLDSALATQYGVAVFTRRPISLVMDSNPLIVDYCTPVNEVSKMSMARKTENIYDYVIITNNSKYYGIVSIKSLLSYTTTLECNYAKQLNPLTELPGNTVIQNNINNIIEAKRTCSVLYFDLDNFKIYNDTYGFENGDRVLKYTAQLIHSEIKSRFPYNGFIGHIGGDDFVGIIENPIEECEKLCENIIKKFDMGILNFFNEKDRHNKYVEATDRRGNKDVFPITSLSIAGIYGALNSFSDPKEVGLFTAAIKKEAKFIKGSCYLIKTVD